MESMKEIIEELRQRRGIIPEIVEQIALKRSKKKPKLKKKEEVDDVAGDD